MQAFRAIWKAVSAFHRWFMKYSGTPMIIDSIEERRRWRQSSERSEEASGTSSEGDTTPQEQKPGPITQTYSAEDSSGG